MTRTQPCIPGVLPVSESWSGSLELVLVLLETVLPKDFKRFK